MATVTHSPVYLRCTTLSSIEFPLPEQKPSATSTEGPGPIRTWLNQQPVLAHWQLVCHDIIFEIKKDGSFFSLLRFNIDSLHNNTRTEIYREKIGTTTLGPKFILEEGLDCINEGVYSAFWRNCQTSTKRHGGKQGANFTWPWRSSHVAMIACAGVIGGVAVWYFVPLVAPAMRFRVIETTAEATKQGACPVDWSMGVKCVKAGYVYIRRGTKSYLRFSRGRVEVLRVPVNWALFNDAFLKH